MVVGPQHLLALHRHQQRMARRACLGLWPQSIDEGMFGKLPAKLGRARSARRIKRFIEPAGGGAQSAQKAWGRAEDSNIRELHHLEVMAVDSALIAAHSPRDPRRGGWHRLGRQPGHSGALVNYAGACLAYLALRAFTSLPSKSVGHLSVASAGRRREAARWQTSIEVGRWRGLGGRLCVALLRELSTEARQNR